MRRWQKRNDKTKIKIEVEQTTVLILNLSLNLNYLLRLPLLPAQWQTSQPY